MAALRWVVKGAGTGGGESLFVTSLPPYPLKVTEMTLHPGSVSFEAVGNATRTCHLQRAFTLSSNDWHNVTSIVVGTSGARWTAPDSNAWPKVFYRLRSE